MATSNIDFKESIRSFTGISDDVVDDEDFSIVLEDAKRHVQIQANISDEDVDWYGNPRQEEALSWATKLFLKVAAGELDSQTIQVGAIDHKSLLSEDGDEITIWSRNLTQAIRGIEVDSGYGVVSSERRTYGGGATGGAAGGTNIDTSGP
jgi:hypothetical protein